MHRKKINLELVIKVKIKIKRSLKIAASSFQSSAFSNWRLSWRYSRWWLSCPRYFRICQPLISCRRMLTWWTSWWILHKNWHTRSHSALQLCGELIELTRCGFGQLGCLSNSLISPARCSSFYIFHTTTPFRWSCNSTALKTGEKKPMSSPWFWWLS